MSSGTGARGVPVGALLVVGVGLYFGWPYLTKLFTKPPAEPTPTATLPTSGLTLSRDSYLGKTSAERRDAMVEEIKKSTFYRPSLTDLMTLDSADFTAVQAALAARDATKKPWLTDPNWKSQLLFPKDKLVNPKQTDELLAAMLGLHKEETARPAIPPGKTLTPEELAAAVQPAVPMIRMRQAVKATFVVAGAKSETADVSFDGSGTGFVIDAAGHVVTNWHVAAEPPHDAEVIAQVAAAKKVKPSEVKLTGKLDVRPPEITLVFQGRHRPFAKSLPAVGPAEAQRPFTLPARLVGSDEASDLAVLKVDGCTFPYLTFADPAGLKVGQPVMSVGYPKGDAIPGDPTAIDGGISGLNRSPASGRHADSVQHSAHINGGNSGGPLINRAGQVVGVNTYGLADSSVQGINFSRGPRTAAPFVEQIIRLGRVVRPATGFGVTTLDFRRDKISRAANLAYDTALVVASREPTATVQLYDIILQLDGRPAATTGEWLDALGLLEKARPGSVKLMVKRPPATLRAEALAGKVADDTVFRAAWEAKETEVTVPLTWPK